MDLVRIYGTIWHHTATSLSASDAAVVGLLRYGRPGLSGPLAQLGLGRDGTFYVIAAGKANHNGYGTYGNQTIGIEAFNSGVGEPWPAAQYDAWVKGTAALADAGWAVALLGHKESDPTRKIDPAGIDMNKARYDVLHYQEGDEDDMPSEAFHRAETDRLIAAFKAENTRQIQDRATRLYRVNNSVKAVYAYLKARFGAPPTS